MGTRVDITLQALKELQKLRVPQVRRKFFLWVSEVETKGVLETRRRPGWHDEPLRGTRAGQRSVRLNDQWRAIYWEKDGTVCIEVIEVTPHDY